MDGAGRPQWGDSPHGGLVPEHLVGLRGGRRSGLDLGDRYLHQGKPGLLSVPAGVTDVGLGVLRVGRLLPGRRATAKTLVLLGGS
jgi:hypothetical protein